MRRGGTARPGWCGSGKSEFMESPGTGGHRGVEIWLWLTAALVFVMIVVGGATRLTDSGLSITEWKPILGAIPPLHDTDWQAAFEKYKQIPEYHLVNKGMALEDFKFIFWWEWGHRFLGRLIGLVFALPLAVFWWTGRIRTGLAPKLLSLLGLGGLQGAIGWYMVSSGLSERIDVSQYRLALHLSVAFAILSLLVWLALEERWHRLGFARETVGAGVRRLATILLGLVFVQVGLGAFVAGLKAGLVYNTWPSMNGQFVPSDYWTGDRGLLSLFESHAAVQFNHRLTAYALLIAALVQASFVFADPKGSHVRTSASVLAAAVTVQASLGIWTLLAHVPLGLGLMHQGGAAIVMGLAVWHLHATRRAAA